MNCQRTAVPATRSARTLRTAVVLFAALLSAAVLGAATADHAPAQTAMPFTGTAIAAGVRVTVVVPRFLVTETLADSGAPISQAHLSALGGQAFASSFYPGDTATAQQGTALIGLPPPPDYPLQVSASWPTTPKSEAAPAGQAMSAEAGTIVASSRAAAGGPTTPRTGAGGSDASAPASSISQTRVEALADGTVVARAESVVEGASFPGGVTIGRITSVVTSTLAPGASAPAVETTTTVTGAEVAGAEVAIGPEGVTGPQPAALPAGTTQALDEALARAGTSVRRVKGDAVTGGASSDVVEIRSTASSVPGVPGATVVYRLGGATATVIAGSSLAPGASAPPLAVGGTTSPPPGGPSPIGAEAPALPSTSRPAAPAPVFDLAPSPRVPRAPAPVVPIEAPASGTDTAGPSFSGADAVAAPAGFGRPRLAVDLRDELGLLYLALILGGVAAFVAASVLRRKGVQRQWNS